MMMLVSKLVATSSLVLGNCLTNNSNSSLVGIPCEITTSNSIFKLQHNVTVRNSWHEDDVDDDSITFVSMPSMIVVKDATNVTIDLNYYTIHGPTTSGTGAGSSTDSRITSAIQLINSNNVNIMNGNVYGFDYGITTTSSTTGTGSTSTNTSNNKKDDFLSTEKGITIFNTLFSNQSYSAIHYVNKDEVEQSSSMTIDQSTFECSFTTTTSTTNCIHYESNGKFTLSNSLVEKETISDLSTDNADVINHNTKTNPPSAAIFISKANDNVTIINNVIFNTSGSKSDSTSNGIILKHDISSNSNINIHSNCILNNNDKEQDDDDNNNGNGIIYEQRYSHKTKKSNNGKIDITKNIITGYPIGIYMNQITCSSSSSSIIGNDCNEHIAPKIMYNCIGNSKNVGIWSYVDDDDNSIRGIRGITIYENDFFYNTNGDFCIGNELRCGTTTSSVTSTSRNKKASTLFSHPKSYIENSKKCICPLLKRNDVGALGLHLLPKDKDVDSSNSIMTEIK